MKITKPLLIGALAMFSIAITSCESETNPKNNEQANSLPKLNVWEVPASRTEVASFSKKIEEDKLNNSNFEVKIYTTDASATKGDFEIELGSGPGAISSVVKNFPKWYENNIVKPVVMNADSLKYGAVIGFDPGDGSFKDLFVVKFDNQEITLNRTKFYSLTKQQTK